MYEDSNDDLSFETDEENTSTCEDDSLVNEDLVYDPIEFTPILNTSRSSAKNGSGAVSITMTPGNGNRLTISSRIMSKLSNPDIVQVEISRNTIAISKQLEESSSSYNVKKNGQIGVIYNAALVRKIADTLKLDFSGGRTTITLYSSKIQIYEDKTIAVIAK